MSETAFDSLMEVSQSMLMISNSCVQKKRELIQDCIMERPKSIEINLNTINKT